MTSWLNNSMKRRTFIRGAAAAAAGLFADTGLIAETITRSKFLVTINMTGGWDVSSFCDPKLNVEGEPTINTWAKTKGILQKGNLQFADYGNNSWFFAKHWENILVINGIDSQTNSHGASTRASFTGSLREGLPTLSSLYATEFGRELATPHLSLGSGVTYSNLEMVKPIRISSLDAFKSAIYANRLRGSSNTIIPEKIYQRILDQKKASISRAIQESELNPGNLVLRDSYRNSIDRLDSLKDFVDISLPITLPKTGFGEQVEIAMSAFLSGQTICADLGPVYSSQGGSFSFDTHAYHDENHESYLVDALEGIDYLWTLAEQTGIADNLIVIVSSDFGRTPFYNQEGGKDHWPIGSTMIMERNAPYTNRTIGKTDEVQNAERINPTTLEIDNFQGLYLNPSHIQLALRDYLNIYKTSQRYPLVNVDRVNFFG